MSLGQNKNFNLKVSATIIRMVVLGLKINVARKEQALQVCKQSSHLHRICTLGHCMLMDLPQKRLKQLRTFPECNDYLS